MITSCKIIIPTSEAGIQLRSLLTVLVASVPASAVLIIDSSSSDDTVCIAESFGVESIVIPREDFNHGATRQLGVDMFPDAEFFVYMTQDAQLADDKSLNRLLSCFEDSSVGAAYGRQLPSRDATPVAAHARTFNYPSSSSVRSREDFSRLGIKAAFISNSFAAYRRSALQMVGGFSSGLILGEDTCVAAKMLMSGWKIAYCADAQVFHSHNYYPFEEFRRYFDIGVFHSREKWFRESFGKAEGEGKRFVFSEIRHLLKTPLLIPSALLRTVLKYAGYRLGLVEYRIPTFIKAILSMNKGYWKKF